MPIGAYGGAREIMEMVSPVGPVYQAGTLSGNPIATAAGLETLRILEEDPGIYERLNQKAECIATALRQEGEEAVSVNQIGSLLSVFFTPGGVKSYEDAVNSDTKAYARYFEYMLDHGIYLAPAQFEAMFVSDAHSQEDIDSTCQWMIKYFQTILE